MHQAIAWADKLIQWGMQALSLHFITQTLYIWLQPAYLHQLYDDSLTHGLGDAYVRQ